MATDNERTVEMLTALGYTNVKVHERDAFSESLGVHTEVVASRGGAVVLHAGKQARRVRHPSAPNNPERELMLTVARWARDEIDRSANDIRAIHEDRADALNVVAKCEDKMDAAEARIAALRAALGDVG